MPNNGPERGVGAQYNQSISGGSTERYLVFILLPLENNFVNPPYLNDGHNVDSLRFFLQYTWRLPVVVYVIPVIYTNLIQ